MKTLDAFMNTVKTKTITEIKGMLASESKLGHVDRVDAINEYLKNKVDDRILIHDDALIARKYVQKVTNCKARGVDFLLSISEYKQLLTKKTCYYTGITLTDGDSHLPTHKTIDRIDSEIGYVKENCVTCSNIANSIKNAVLENPATSLLLTKAQFKRMANKL